MPPATVASPDGRTTVRHRVAFVVFVAIALVLTACGGGDEDPTATPTRTAAPTADQGAPTAPTPDPRATALGPEVAASVDGAEIPRGQVQERIDLLRANPDIADQLEEPEGGPIEAQLESQALSQMVVTRIVVQGAADEGIEVTDEEVAAARADLVEQAGGEEQLLPRLEAAGLPESQLEQELRGAVAFEKVTAELTGASPTPSPEGQQPMAPEVQEWLSNELQSADVVIAPEFGVWDGATGQVVPRSSS